MTGMELVGLLIGAALLALGVVAAVATTLRLRQGAATTLSFGLLCALYGTRLLAEQPAVRQALGLSDGEAAAIAGAATYSINIAALSFVKAVLGRGWRNSLTWGVRAATAFAGVALLSDLVARRTGTLDTANSVLVLLMFVLIIGNVAFASRVGRRHTLFTDPVVLVGSVIFAGFVVDRNLGDLVLGRNVEAVGMLAFVACLGYAVIRSVVRGEAELAGVQRELETARRIQSSLLPRRLPAVAGIDLAVRYVPAAAVGGDLYDVVALGPGRLGILVADVSGHGIPAALVASMVKLAFSSQAEQADDPGRVLEAMNRTLCRHLEHAYVTAVYVVVDVGRRHVTLANAGHPPVLLHRSGAAEVEPQRDHGLMLGMFPEAAYANTEIPGFAAGDRLLLYSDGVPEARDPRGQFLDPERVADWLMQIERGSCERFATRALDALGRWAGGAQFDDDVTFAVVEASD